jgi:DNA helicase-2/ATP-dependent DNA helicase PcrA
MNPNTIDDLPDYLKNLNAEQVDAVLNVDGPLLVLAGAGTGKTRVLTSKIAHILLAGKAAAHQILAVTFTNKAAKEMRSRVETMLGGIVDGIWMGTFHSIAARILRRHAEIVGLRSDFIIIDYDDQIKLLKQILSDKNIDEKQHPAKLLSYIIGRLKDKAIKSDSIPYSEANGFNGESVEGLYSEYQRRLKSLNAVDFGDLLLYNIEIFQKSPEIFADYQRRFKYILVDEYQDTNVCQYLWLRMLSQGSLNICCVGDDDQSIYGWRGAEVTNILRFDKDYNGAKIVRLERNYRSTQNILDAATAVIANNLDRHGKVLWTDGVKGAPIKLSCLYDEREEARYISEEIEDLARLKKQRYSDVGILVRAGYQTRSFEESLNFLRIPYRIIGGVKFYERAEIKDVIAYIRVLINSSDSLAFERIINLPRRGIGGVTLKQMYDQSRDSGISLYQAACEMVALNNIKGKAQQSLQKLFEDFNSWRLMLSNKKHYQVVETMLIESGYIDMWKEEKTEESRDKLDNIKELIASLEEFASLNEYLEHISLVTDNDNTHDEDRVSVMTIHAAKGLEFGTVFLAGWEEGIFPSQKSIDENGKSGIEEERRLAYVAITRAKENLYITYAQNRRMYGSFQQCLPSRFISELPAKSYETTSGMNSFYKKYNFESIKNQKTYTPTPPPAINNNAKVGERVFHQKFGYGKILNQSSIYAEVSFEKAGVKRVLVDYIEKA